MITVGSDIGGTFTDFVQVDEGTGRIEVFKTLTTPSDPSLAIDQGVHELARRHGGSARDIDVMVHGTTLVINAVIERKGARTGLITTRGFRDVLEIGREKRFDAYDLQIEFPQVLVPRHLRMEIGERLHSSGLVLETLDEASVRNAVDALLKADCESIAVCLLHSYINPEHERRVAEIIEELAPQVSITISSDVLPEMKEYERTSTTVLNAYAKPTTSRYLSLLEERVRAQGFTGELLMMQSSGGINSVEFARRFPVQIIESGPAAGTLGAAHFAKLAGLEKVLAYDMGGTTAKLALVEEGRALRTNDFEVAHMYRFKPGSGLPARISVVDLIEIGAGGGSIAKRTPMGTIQVGPESSSAQPGPACYGQGGLFATVTDADLVLGYLDPDHFLGGRMKLDRDAAVQAISEYLAKPLDVSLEEAAFGVHAIVNENMALAAKAYASERGENPKSCALVGFGGAGPVHACDLADRLGIKTVLIPPRAGVAAAFGMIVAPITYDAVRSRRILLTKISPEILDKMKSELMSECRERMPSTVDLEAIEYEFSADMRYVGQGYEVNVILPMNLGGDNLNSAVLMAFEINYKKLYGRIFSVPLEIMSLRMSASTRRNIVDLPKMDLFETKLNGRIGSRTAYCARTRRWKEFPVYRRSGIVAGVHFPGPAIVEEDESTTVIHSDSDVHIDPSGSLIIKLEPIRSNA